MAEYPAQGSSPWRLPLKAYIDDLIDLVQQAIGQKADAAHTHEGYAADDHTHEGYAADDHTHSGFALVDHEHVGMVTSTSVEEIVTLTQTQYDALGAPVEGVWYVIVAEA